MSAAAPSQKATFFLDLGFLDEKTLEGLERVPTEYWALPRPLTKGWGSGAVWNRIEARFTRPDVAFGVRDGIPPDVLAIDRKRGHEWRNLPFPDRHFKFGYWDPPYDHLYRREGLEIWRTCQRLAILHTHVYPTSWFEGAKREAMVAITMGPLKRIRILQLFRRAP